MEYYPEYDVFWFIMAAIFMGGYALVDTFIRKLWRKRKSSENNVC